MVNPTGRPRIHRTVSDIVGSRMKPILMVCALAAAALAAADVVLLAAGCRTARTAHR